jgi:cytochrome c oxidase subunit 4
MPEQKEHLLSPQTYINVLLSLMALLIITIVMAFVDLDGWTHAHHLGAGWNTAIALTIAIIKAALIALFFMHLKHGSRTTWVFAAAGFVWLSIMLGLTMTDYFTRNDPAGISAKGEPKYMLPR